MRSPSENLLTRLQSLKLCSAAQIVACERYVRRLCQDLPDFDSVWLDALVQQDVLSPWQSEMLQTDNHSEILVGRFQRRFSLGAGTTEGIDLQTGNSVVLQVVQSEPVVAAHRDSASSRSSAGPSGSSPLNFREQLQQLRATRARIPDSLNLPIELLELSDASGTEDARNSADRRESFSDRALRRIVVSRYVSGWTLEDLLVRGGRFPWAAVAEIGRELLTAMSWLESQNQMHGEIVLRNVRLTSGGQVVLVAPFIRKTFSPAVALSERLTLRHCEGVAPEQVGTGRSGDIRSDIYALGCLLWQLLTARPVVLTADPVSRLMKIREHDIPDARQLVPDCPEWMARLLIAMTRRTPELRPSDVRELAAQWNAKSGRSFSACTQIVRKISENRRVHGRRLLPGTPRQLSHNHSRRRAIRSAVVRLAGLSGIAVILMAAMVSLDLLPAPLQLSLDRWSLNRNSQSTTVTEVNSRRRLLPSNEELEAEIVRKTVGRAESDSGGQADPLSGISAIQPMPSVAGLPLPKPDAAGRILLLPGEQYRASDCTAADSLIIDVNTTAGEPTSLSGSTPEASTTPPASALIIVPEGSTWKLTGVDVTLRNLLILSSETAAAEGAVVNKGKDIVPADGTTADSGGTGPALNRRNEAVVSVRSRTLLVESSLVRSSARTPSPCVSWIPVNEAISVSSDAAENTRPKSIQFRNSVLAGGGAGIRVDGTPDEFGFDNVLLACGATGIRWDLTDAGDHSIGLQIHRVTQRTGQSLLDVVVKNQRAEKISLLIAGGETVVTPALSVIRITAPAQWSKSGFQTEFRLPETGNGVIVPPDVPSVVYYDAGLRVYESLPETQIIPESLLIAAPVFADASTAESQQASLIPDTTSFRDFVRGSSLTDYEGPKLNAIMPGISADQLPASTDRHPTELTRNHGAADGDADSR